MFTLKRILNGRTNVSEPLSMASGVSAPTTFKRGTAVAYDDGVLTPVVGDAAVEYVVASDVTVSSAIDEVSLILVTPDMIFEAPVSVAPTGVAAGKRVTISATSDSLTATAATAGGAIVVATHGATAAGDVISVRLA